MRSAALLASASLFVMASVAHAQTVATHTTDAANSTSLAAVVVTAQRRSEVLKNVPLTVTVVSGAALEKAGVTSPRDLQNVVSGLTFSGQGTVSQPSIRGVSTSLSSAGSENPNALYIDGVYQLDQVSLNEELPDVQDVQVLKGPQGTLFGRNATGGAILITTKAPSFTPKGDFTIAPSYYTGAGSSHASGRLDMKGFVSGPLVSDVLAGSLSASTDSTDGYLTNDATGKQTGRINKQNFRGKLLFSPAGKFRATLSAFYIDDQDQGLLGGTPLPGLSAADFFPGSVVPSQPWHIASSPGFFVATAKQYGATLTAQYDFDAGTLKSITAYEVTSSHNLNSVSGAEGSIGCLAAFACIDYDFTVNDDAVSQEFNFTSRKVGIFSYTAGLYYFNAVGNTLGKIQDTLIPGGLLTEADNFETTSYAAYAQGTADITSRFSVDLGLRYNAEPHNDVAHPTIAPFNPDTITRAQTFSSLTPRVNLKYKLTDELNAYFSYAQGQKSGQTGVTNSAIGFKSVAPEVLTAYETGLKYGARNLTLNAAFFYYDYKNKQEQTFTGTSTIIENTGPIRIMGVDFDGNARLSSDFRLNGGLTWIPVAKYLDFPGAAGQSTVFSLACGGFCPGVGTYAPASGVFNDTGGRLIRTPTLTANATLNYTHDVQAGLVDASATVDYSSYYANDITGVVHQSAYATINAQGGIRLHNGIRLGVFGRNLLNKAYLVNGLTSSSGFIAGYAPPQEFGLVANYSF